MKALTVKFAIAYLDKNAFCGVHKYFIILLDKRVLFVSYLPCNDYSISIIYKTFFNVKLMKKGVAVDGIKISKLNSFLEPSLWRTHWGVFTSTVKNLGFTCIADDRPILSPVHYMK